MTDNLAARFATEPPDGTVLVAWRDDVPFVLERDDNAAKELSEQSLADGHRWWDTGVAAPMTFTQALDGATRVEAVVPLERSGLDLRCDCALLPLDGAPIERCTKAVGHDGLHTTTRGVGWADPDDGEDD